MRAQFIPLLILVGLTFCEEAAVAQQASDPAASARRNLRTRRRSPAKPSRSRFAATQAGANALPSPTLSAEAGHQLTRSLSSGDWPHNRFSLLLSVAMPLSPDWKLSAAVMAITDTKTPFSNGDKTFTNLQGLAAAYTNGPVKLTLGMQTINWSEAFGLSPADFVNPHDYGERWYLDSPLQRIPLGMLNLQIFLGSFDVQALYVPLPRRSPFPFGTEASGLEKPEEYEAFADAEYGFRAGGVVAGWELRTLYHSYWNRVPVFKLGAGPAGAALALSEARVDSIGLQFNNGGDSNVVRGESVFTFGQPVQDLNGGEPGRFDLVQTALGLDHTTADGLFLAGQYNVDLWEERPEGFRRRAYHWLGGRLTTSVWNGRIEPGFTAIAGLGHDARWIQGKVVGKATGSLRLGLQFDDLDTKEPELELLFVKGRYISIFTSWKF